MRLHYRCINSYYRYILLIKTYFECAEARSVSVEDWIEVQGKEKNQQLTAEHLPMNIKLVLQQLGPQMSFEAFAAFLQTLISQVCPIRSFIGTLRAGEQEQNMCSWWQLSTS